MSNLYDRIKQSPNLRWFILANVVLGTFMASLDGSIVNVSLPTISTMFKVDLSTIQWVVTAYLLIISSLLPVFGRLSDLWGRKRVYSSGFILFTAGSVLCGLSDNIWFLIGMRIVQAIGASMIMSNSQAIIVSSFPFKERGRALGLSGTVVALGSLIGPALGGFLVSWVGWRSIFYVNVPIGIIAYLAAQIILPADKEKKEVIFDFRGSALFTLGLICTLFAINNGEDFGWTSWAILSSLILGVVLLGAFFYNELRVGNPLIDFSIYRNRPFMIGNLTAFLNFVTIFANIMLTPFYLQSVLNFPTSKVGLMMAIFPVCMAIVAPISGYVSDKIGPIGLTTGGLFINTIGFVFLLTVTIHSSYLQIAPSLILFGIGSGMFQSPNNSSVMSAVGQDQIGMASGLNALVRNLGIILGTSFSVLLFENRQAAFLAGINHPTANQMASTFVSAFHVVMFMAGGITLITAFISLSRKGYVLTEKN